MEKKCVTILIEREKVGKKTIFVAYSLDVNVVSQGATKAKAEKNFKKAMKLHLKHQPLIEEELIDHRKVGMPMISRIFL